jgi:hypothetical protein
MARGSTNKLYLLLGFAVVVGLQLLCILGPVSPPMEPPATPSKVPAVPRIMTVPPVVTRPPITASPTDPPMDVEIEASPPPEPKRIAPVYRFVINVFTYNRLPGLRRLLQSLLAADYLTHDGYVTLRIFMDYPKKGAEDFGKAQETREFLAAFHWPFGSMHMHRRELNVGLKRSIMEAWYPLQDNEVGAFFEDDVEVSPLWYPWAVQALDAYAPPNQTDPKLLGISLFRPIHDELSGKGCVVKNGNQPFALQQPCSWGAVYLPAPWRAFRDWYDEEGVLGNAECKDKKDRGVHPSSNTWASKSSWKKYLIKHMYDKGWYMVYPNHDRKQVLSTNHLMEGEHPTPPKALFELPLVDIGVKASELSEADRKAFFQFPPLDQLKAFDVMFRPTSSGTIETLPNR